MFVLDFRQIAAIANDGATYAMMVENSIKIRNFLNPVKSTG